LVAAKQQYQGRGVEVAGIGIDDAAKIRQFAAIFAVNYPIFVGTPQTIQLMRRLGNGPGGLPYNVILDSRRVIAHRKLGAFTAAELRQVVDGLLR
jgi:hypothetical protein